MVVDTAQIENKEAYAPQISLEGSRIVVQVPSTWYMTLFNRSLNSEGCVSFTSLQPDIVVLATCAPLRQQGCVGLCLAWLLVHVGESKT